MNAIIETKDLKKYFQIFLNIKTKYSYRDI